MPPSIHRLLFLVWPWKGRQGISSCLMCHTECANTAVLPLGRQMCDRLLLFCLALEGEVGKELLPDVSYKVYQHYVNLSLPRLVTG